MRSREVATYRYTDRHGVLLYEVVRYEPKGFRIRRYNDSGKAVWNLDGVPRVPYRLPELLAAIENDEVIIVVEGEKDADALCALGFCATTNAGGAGWMWTPDFIDYFRGASVIVVADNDEAGRAAALARAKALL